MPGSSGAEEPTLLCATLIILGGIHYGYNGTIVACTADLLRTQLQTSLLTLETLASTSLVGAIIGSPISGVVAEKFGRRTGTIIGESCSLLGAIGSGVSENIKLLIFSRLLIGIGVGFCTLAKPLYVTECIGAGRKRAVILALFSPSVAIGILIANLSSNLLGSNWQLEFVLGGVPAFLLLMIGIFAMPESKVFLANQMKVPREEEETYKRLGEEEQGIAPPQPSLLSAAGRYCLALALCLAAANQATGDYAIVVYGKLMLSDPALGLGVDAASLDQLGVGYFVLICEISPPEWKTPVYSFGNAARYFFELISSFFFLSAIETLGSESVMWFFACICMACAAYLQRYLLVKQTSS